jgi:hypothetical protein
VHNGAAIRPGIYTLISHNVLTRYELKNIEVPNNEKQKLEFTIPAGKANIKYTFVQQPDNNGRRCWVNSVDAKGIKSKKRSSEICDGREIVLNEGRYFVSTWSSLGDFEDTYFDVVVSQTSEVSIQQNSL